MSGSMINYFSGALPHVMITLQRKPRMLGYFSALRFSGRIENLQVHEIALNPDGFIGASDEDILSTLVHEMCHLQQFGEDGKNSKYHNQAWAMKMEHVGLIPSDTGKPGGK